MVTELSVPHAEPLQPVPLSDQLMIALGLEPVTGVSVATITAVAEVVTVPGAASCSVKWLVMVTPTIACFEGSAALCAIMLTFAGDGRICGAVKFPLRRLCRTRLDRNCRLVSSEWWCRADRHW